MHEAHAAPGDQNGDTGATAVEYALLIALIAGVIVGAVLFLGPEVAALYDRASQGW